MHSTSLSTSAAVGGTSWYRGRFEVLREAHGVRDLELVLVVYTLDNNSEAAVAMLREDVAVVKARGGSTISSLYRWRSSSPQVCAAGSGLRRSVCTKWCKLIGLGAHLLGVKIGDAISFVGVNV